MSWSPVQVQRAIEYALEKMGYTSLKEKQREAVEAFVAANDTFVSTNRLQEVIMLQSSTFGF